MDLLVRLRDPSLMEEAARMLTAALGAQLREAPNAPARKNPRSPRERFAQASAALDGGRATIGREEAAARLCELAQEIMDGTLNWHSPRNIGHQVCSPIAFAGVLGLLNGVLNSGTAINEVGELAIAAERAVIARLGRLVGWEADRGFDGIATSGGSLANLTGILAARNFHVRDAWTQGLGGRRLAILCNADSHYSVVRAAGIIGIGVDQVIKVALDEKRRMSVTDLKLRYEQALRDGLEPFCVVGSAGTTGVGAFDPLTEIGTFTRGRELWLHVDAAHGGGLLFSAKHRSKLAGIELADSIAWDAHKMMHVPTLCTFLLYRERARSFLPFQQEAPYLFDELDESAFADPAQRTLECTRPAMATPLWVLWSVFGPEVFQVVADRLLETTRAFHALTTNMPDFAPAHDPECNIFCFRHLPENLRGATQAQVSAFQRSVRKEVLRRGQFYITGTELDGQYTLRVTFMNPGTGEAHLGELLDEIRLAATAVSVIPNEMDSKANLGSVSS